MRARIPLAALALATVTGLVVAAPAAAAPSTSGDVTVGGTTWYYYSFEEGESPYIDGVDRDDWIGYDYTYDSGLYPIYLPSDAEDIDDTDYLNCAADGDLSAATDGTGDQILACELEPFSSGDGQLEARFELRFFDDGRTVRSRLTVTNDNDVAVSGAAVGFYENHYQDDDTRIGASTNAGHPAPVDSTTADGDLQWVIYSTGENYETPVLFTAAGTADAVTGPIMTYAAGNGQDDQESLYPLPTLEPGASIEVVQFTVWNFFEYELDITEAPVDESTGESETDTDGAEEGTEEVTEQSAATERELAPVEGGTKTTFLYPAALFEPAALAAVAESWAERDRFDTLSERDAAGITDPSSVVNWAPAAEEELAETGPADIAPALAVFAAMLMLAGIGFAAARRRTA